MFDGQRRRGPATPDIRGFPGGGCDDDIFMNVRVGCGVELDIVDSKLRYDRVVGVDRSCRVTDVEAVPQCALDDLRKRNLVRSEL